MTAHSGISLSENRWNGAFEGYVVRFGLRTTRTIRGPSVPAAERVLREHECCGVGHHEAKHHQAETPQPRVSL